MIQGIGIDIIETKRIAKAIDRFGARFLDRIFTPSEQQYCKQHRDAYRHFAGRFAAKEAAVKALGTGFRKEVGWLDIQIVNDMQGKPSIAVSSHLKSLYEPFTLHVSISHCHDYATAFVIMTNC